MLLCLSNAIYSKVIMFIYYLNTFVCCCIINLHFLFRLFCWYLGLFCSCCWYLSVLLVSFSLNHLTTPRMHKILVSILLASFYSSTRILHACTKFWCQFCWHHFTAQRVYSTRAQNFGVNFSG